MKIHLKILIKKNIEKRKIPLEF